mmetsp:Transcript_1239/g.2034  ORF Transcript_1239/g.2034 Transcript_1239/m.2034 type:complete len:202 (+) Transcript_1239:86-691(+)
MGSVQEDPAMSNTSFNSNYIQVKPSQKGNPVLSCIRNVHWQYNAAIVPDYVMGSSTCALYISIRYHLVHPQYLYRRMKEVGRDYRLRVVVCKVDVEDSDKPLLELNKLCFSNRFTLLLTWSDLEAGRYIETLKAYETKPSSSIQQRVESEFLPKLTSVLRNVRQLNRTDVATLLDGFRSFQGICKADEQQLILCPGTVMKI